MPSGSLQKVAIGQDHLPYELYGSGTVNPKLTLGERTRMVIECLDGVRREPSLPTLGKGATRSKNKTLVE